MQLVKTIILSAVLSSTSMAANIGELQILGSGCTNKDSQIKLIDESQSTYSIPLNLYVKKDEDKVLARESCNMMLPVTLAADEKLIIENVSQKVNTRVNAGGEAKTQLEVFLAGDKGEILKAESAATESYISSRHHLSQEGVVAESKCGESVIVRANSAGIVKGSVKVRIYHEDLKLNLKIVKCQ